MRKSRISVGGCVPRIDPDKLRDAPTSRLTLIAGVGREGLAVWRMSRAQRMEIEAYLEAIETELARRRKP